MVSMDSNSRKEQAVKSCFYGAITQETCNLLVDFVLF